MLDALGYRHQVLPPSIRPLDDILAKLDEVERRLHDALALTETSIRVCQQALAATALLRRNLLIYGPGGYRFSDFVRAGVPLTVIVGVIVAVLARVLWPS
mgnify:CR=1 FL=1